MPLPSAGGQLFLMTDANATEVAALSRGLQVTFASCAAQCCPTLQQLRGYKVAYGAAADVMTDVLVAAGATRDSRRGSHVSLATGADKFLGNVWSTVSWAVVEEVCGLQRVRCACDV
jgi:hypothetical protein